MHKLSLDDMSKNTYQYKTPYIDRVNTDYQYVFSSGHVLTLSQVADDDYWVTFKHPEGRSGEMKLTSDPKEALEKFMELLNGNVLRSDLMVGFEF